MKATGPVVLRTLSGAVVAVLLAATFSLHKERQAHERAVTPVLETIAREQAAVARLERILATLEADAEELRSTLAPAAAPAARPPQAEEDPFVRRARLERDPKFQLAELALRRAELQLRYGAFYRELGLSPEQIARFEAAEAKHDEEQQDLQAAAREKGVGPVDPSLRPLWEKLSRERFEAHEALLGPDGRKQWQDYERTWRAREFVEHAAGAAAMNGVPINRTQAEALLEAVKAAAGPRKRTVQLGQVDWAAADAQARAILSPEQFAIFQSASPVEGQSRHTYTFGAVIRKALEAEFADGASGTAAGGP